MTTTVTVIIGIIVGAIADHYVEARSVAALTKAINAARDLILLEIRKISK